MSIDNISLFPQSTTVSPDGHLVIGRCDAISLASRYGTPLYVLDEDHIRSKCREFKTAFARLYQNTNVAYASKACLNKAITKIMAQEGMELDVVSGGELAIALSARFPAEKIYFHGNNKSEEELTYALENKIGHIVADNVTELEIIDRLARQIGHYPDVFIRITPGVQAHTHHHITTGHSGSKFGVYLDDAPETIRLAGKLNGINLVGLHCHLGSQLHETIPYTDALEVLLKLGKKMHDEQGFNLKELSLGGGFGVSYTLEDNALPVENYAVAITGLMVSMCERLEIPLPRLIIEPGRSIVGPAGVTLYRVGMQKQAKGYEKYIAIDGGMADNIRPALYDAKYVVAAAGKMLDTCTEKVTIAGKYCESGDILAKDVMLPSVKAGDILAVPVTGAYCIPMASNYNGALKPAVVMVGSGRSRLVRRREEYADLIRLDQDEGV